MWSKKCVQTVKAQLFQVCNLFDDWNINCNSLINSIKPYDAYKIELLKFMLPNHPLWSLPNPWKFIISLAVKHSAFSPRMTFFLEKMLLPPSPFLCALPLNHKRASSSSVLVEWSTVISSKHCDQTWHIQMITFELIYHNDYLGQD